MEKIAWVIGGLMILIILGSMFGGTVSRMFGAKQQSTYAPWPLWKKIAWGVPVGTLVALILSQAVKK